MNTKPALPLLAAALVALALPAHAAFDCGSTGLYGPITVATDEQRTITNLPADGVLHVTTLTIAGGGSLRFANNANNTPVHILCQGDAIINGYVFVNGAAATADAGGLAGPGGFDGGRMYPNTTRGSDGFGPGAGRGGLYSRGRANHAALSSPDTEDGLPYGNVLQLPLIGGSGGGAYYYGWGGGGGGALLVASNTRIVLNGSIQAMGGSGAAAGGGLRLVAPKVEGSGNLYVQGSDGAGRGRARIDTLDPTNQFIVFNPPEARVIGANMIVFPPAERVVAIIDVAGTTVDPSTNAPVTIVRPPDSATNLPVTVRATGFTGTVNVKVALTPASLPRRIYPLAIDMGGNATATGIVNVDFDTNMLTRVDAWAETAP